MSFVALLQATEYLGKAKTGRGEGRTRIYINTTIARLVKEKNG